MSLDVTATQLDTLRASQLKEASDTLDRVAGALSMLSVSADVSDPLSDVAAAIRLSVRISMRSRSLGYRDRVHEM